MTADEAVLDQRRERVRGVLGGSPASLAQRLCRELGGDHELVREAMRQLDATRSEMAAIVGSDRGSGR